MKKVIIVDDHKMFLDGLSSLLTKEAYEVFTASDSASALDIMMSNTIDIALLDIEMPDSAMSGVELTAYLRDRFPDLRILVVSMFKTQQLVDAMIGAGAHGYLPKDSDHNALIRALKMLEAGNEYWSPDLMQMMVEHKRKEALQTAGKDNLQDVRLTKREKDILALLAQGLSSKEIAVKLSISNNTVDTHRKNVISKFSAKNTSEALLKANKLGLL